MKVIRLLLSSVLCLLCSALFAASPTFPTPSTTSITKNSTTGNLTAGFNTGNQTITVSTGGITGPGLEQGIAPARNGLAPRQAVVFDGTAQATLSGWSAFGSSDFSIQFLLKPTSFTAAQGLVWGETNAFGFKINADGTVTVKIVGGADLTASTAALVAGKTSRISYVRSGSTGTYYINGVPAGTTTDNNNYSMAPIMLGSASGANYFTGAVLAVEPYNRALSAAEVLTLYETCAPKSADRNIVTASDGTTTGARQTSVIVGNDSTFAADSGWWTKAGTTITGGKAVLDNSGYGLTRANLLGRGAWYTLTFTVGSYSLGVGGHGVVQDGTGTIVAINANGTVTTTFQSTGTSLQFFNQNDTFTVDDVTLIPLGLLCDPESNAPGNDLVWNDQSGNGAHIVLPTSGVAWALPDGRNNILRGTTTTNGNQQLLGSTTLQANTQILRIRAKASTGTPAITLGTSSGGSDIVSSVTLSTSWKDLTIALTGGIVGSNSSVWVGSNTTATISTNILTSPLSSP